MADVQTTDINTKPVAPSIDSNDQIFISDGGTALKKISYTNLAKAIIEQYNASQLAGATKTIQAAFNELNSNLATEIHAGTVSEFLSSLQTLGGSMQVGSFKYIKYTPSETTRKFVSGHVYGGLFNRTGSNYWAISLADPEGNPVYGMYRNGIWVWDRIAIGAEVDALNSNTYLLTGGTKINAAFDFDSLSTPGSYYVDGSVAATHSPVATNITGLIKVEHTVGHADEYLRQTYYPYRATDGYFVRIRNNSTWGNWVQEPTRVEMDAVAFKANAGTSGTTFKLSNGYRGILYIMDSSAEKCGEYIVWTTGAGAFGKKDISAASEVTIVSNASGQVTITASTGNRVAMFSSAQGTVSMAS